MKTKSSSVVPATEQEQEMEDAEMEEEAMPEVWEIRASGSGKEREREKRPSSEEIGEFESSPGTKKSWAAEVEKKQERELEDLRRVAEGGGSGEKGKKEKVKVSLVFGLRGRRAEERRVWVLFWH